MKRRLQVRIAIRKCKGTPGWPCPTGERLEPKGPERRCDACRIIWRRLLVRKSHKKNKKKYRARAAAAAAETVKKKTLKPRVVVEDRWRKKVEEAAEQHPGRAELMELARQAGRIKFREKP